MHSFSVTSTNIVIQCGCIFNYFDVIGPESTKFGRTRQITAITPFKVIFYDYDTLTFKELRSSAACPKLSLWWAAFKPLRAGWGLNRKSRMLNPLLKRTDTQTDKTAFSN